MPRKTTRKAAPPATKKKTVAKAKSGNGRRRRSNPETPKAVHDVKTTNPFVEPDDLDPDFVSEDDEDDAPVDPKRCSAVYNGVRCRLPNAHPGQHDSEPVNGVSYSWD